MSYTPTTWTTGDTITATKLNKIEQGIASAGGGYDFVITGEWDDEWINLSLESGSYSALSTAIQNGAVISGVFVGDTDGAIRPYQLCIYSTGEDTVNVAFMGASPDDSSFSVWYFIIGDDGSVVAD